MPTPLKYLYNDQFFDQFCHALNEVYDKFDSRGFMESVYANGWEEMELKQRMRHISTMLQQYLPSDYSDAIAVILKLVAYAKKHHEGMALEYMFLPDFIEQYGLNEVELSINAMEQITSLTSCEFAVRPFIIRDQPFMMEQMLEWSKSEDHHLRRLASEGCRPRLPWAMALPTMKQDPSDILPVLENLKQDPSEYVRKSVANNLNDISKDHPEIVMAIAKRWKGASKNTDWIVKHGCRTLLKRGNREVLRLFDFGSIQKIKIENFKVLTPLVKTGNYMSFQFELINTAQSAAKIRLEYGIYYQKVSGSLSKRVFMLSEKSYAAGETVCIHRRQSFKRVSSRKLYPGLHRVGLIVNGEEVAMGDFFLEM